MALHEPIPSSTREHFYKKMADSFYTGTPVMKVLSGKNKKLSGGRKIILPLLTNQASAGTFVGMEPLDVVDAREVDSAQYDMKYYWAGIGMSEPDLSKNSGPEQAVSVWSAKIQNASLTLNEKVTKQMFSANADLDPDGINSLDDICWSSGTVGELAETDIVNEGTNMWAGRATSVGGAFTLQPLEDNYLACSEGNVHPDLYVASKTGFSYVWKLLVANQRYLAGDEAFGFQNLKFNDAMLVWDSHVIASGGNATGNRIYALNTDYLFLYVHSDYDFVEREKEPSNAAAFLVYVYWFGQLCTNNRRFQGVVHNFTAPA